MVFCLRLPPILLTRLSLLHQRRVYEDFHLKPSNIHSIYDGFRKNNLKKILVRIPLVFFVEKLFVFDNQFPSFHFFLPISFRVATLSLMSLIVHLHFKFCSTFFSQNFSRLHPPKEVKVEQTFSDSAMFPGVLWRTLKH